MLSIKIQLRSISSTGIEGKDRYLVEIISHIGKRVASQLMKLIDCFSKCYVVCGNNCEVSSVTILLPSIAFTRENTR